MADKIILDELQKNQDKDESQDVSVPMPFDFALMLKTLNAEREGQLLGEKKSNIEFANSEVVDVSSIMKTYIKENGIANFLGKMNEVVRLQGYHFVENEVEQNFSGKRIKF